jgi:redox-sensitive bicupin YhaK (pirin superfamily)
MIKIIDAEDRHCSDFGWLQTYWLFSFSSYYDPENIQHGALRVYNDDIVQPGTGFPTHPHEEMEIVTIVLSGEMTHRDSMGNEAVIKAGDVQRMSAGTGLTHSEFNLTDEPVHFHQIWIHPDVAGLKPTYDQKSYTSEAWINRLLAVASGQSIPDVVTLNTDATIFRASLEGGRKLRFDTAADRKLFVYVTNGGMKLNGLELKEKSQARIDLESALLLEALADCEFILIDTPSCKGWGYSEETLRGGRVDSI